ncbi:hypothetical protein GQR60_07400 [Labilibaculum sp. A4]|uniref:hypothetical protein n=1 Tax=Labilibaculum euxinus TaxID=2686357 RepID=UPI000F61D8A7|nr:hypothetical protein [Labilibaculum euxinus]MDQ1769601.1 hypothetical protein [Labilibaculum euxinus]MWN76158.1 hypothetical protein [Labilibaculum euxinus]
MKLEIINAVSGSINTLVGIGILLVAYVQLKKVKEQLKNLSDNQRNSTLMTVLELESEMYRRKEAFDNISFEIRSLGEDEGNPSEKQLEIFQDRFNVSLENYLNSLDRLSYCIIYKYLSDRDWKTEYRDLIFDVVDSYESKYGTSSRFRNTKELYERWKKE